MTRLRGRYVAVIALAFYPGLGLLIPLAIGWPPLWLISANLWGVVLAGTICLMWLGVRVMAQQRRHLVEWTTDVRLLDAIEFEWLVGELFRREGWKVEETGQHGAPDGNVDLRLSRRGERRLVQCKRCNPWQLGVQEVREFAGMLASDGFEGRDGIFVTLSDYTPQAREHAKRSSLTPSVVPERCWWAPMSSARW